MDETIGRKISLSDSDFNLCLLGLPYNLAGCEPLGYMFSYCSLLEPSLPIVGSGFGRKFQKF